MGTTSEKVDLLENTIQQLIESRQHDSSFIDHRHADDAKDTQILAQLLSEFESLKEDGTVKLSEASDELNQVPSDTADEEAEMKNTGETKASGGDVEDREEEVVKELENLKKQNRTTQWLVSALIVVTVAWQISEISLLLKLKRYLIHPFRSLGSMVTGMFRHPKSDDDEEESTQQNGIIGLINPSG